MKLIKLCTGRTAKVDNEDYKRLSKYHWHETGSYPYRWVGGRKVFLHREVLNLGRIKGEGIYIDHINNDTLDCRKENLREATHQQNQFNSGPRRGSTSKFKGVSWYKRTRRWRAQIKLNQKTLTIGYFKCAEEAAKAYNEKAKELFGEFAYLNEV